MLIPETEFAFAGNARLRPDLSILRTAKWAEIDIDKIPVAVVPDIAVEIVPPSESARQLDRKVQVYREAGVMEVWVIYPDFQHLFVYGSGSLRELREPDTLASPLLPGWSIAVKDLFKV